MRFENQTAVVAACGSDAGAACALNYLQQGAKVALYYDEEARLWPFDQISEEERSRLLTIQISDFRDHEELKRAADQVKEKFGTCDIVVTAVTTVPSKPAYDMDEEEYDRVMKTITNGSLYTIQPLMPMMIEKIRAHRVGLQYCRAHSYPRGRTGLRSRQCGAVWDGTQYRVYHGSAFYHWKRGGGYRIGRRLLPDRRHAGAAGYPPRA
mgnify:CR=1 FL=1